MPASRLVVEFFTLGRETDKPARDKPMYTPVITSPVFPQIDKVIPMLAEPWA